MQHKPPLQRKKRPAFTNTMQTWRRFLAAVCASLVVPVAWAIEEPAPTPASAKAFRHPDLTISHRYDTVGQLPEQAADLARQALADLGVGVDAARVDRRGGRFATLLPARPLIPGTGVGNRVQWDDLQDSPPGTDAARKGAAWKAFVGYLRANAPHLNIDVDELPSPGRVTLASGGDIVQIYAQRTIDGVPVRDTYVNAVINHGNLILFGTQNWGDINLSTEPKVGLDKARAAVAAHLKSLTTAGEWDNAELIIAPMARGRDVAQVALGQGYNYRLAWVIRPLIAGDLGRWEALVDARSGTLLSFEDTNHYAEVKGGVLPVTNDGIVPDGVEQGGWPMPYADVGAETTDTGGNFSSSGTVTTDFYGPYVNINDNCGTSSLTGSGTLDWGTSSGTDCDTPGFGGAGNTHSSRTGFYELNKIMEMARGQLPSNSWLQQRLTANMNINSTCNAYWNGTVNFYRSGGGCSNTGEIAGVFDHEWGHGMDANDATPGIASPSGEGIADIYTALRLNDSCIGRNFRSTVCTGNGDPCLTCTGVRDIDYLKRQSGQPHDYSWSNSNCGGSVHCVGGVYSEAVWSLWKRKLQSAPYNYDNNTAHEIVNRLTFIGAGATGTWFSGGPPNGGCAGTSGYMNYLAADDDNGDLNDGTPHMQAIFDAFNAQEIACNTPTVQDSGCAGVPTAAPVVTATAGNNSVNLNWGSVAGASTYQVFRTEGVFQCDFGKVKVGETAGTTWNDTGLQNGRDYSYVVIPVGASNACMGPASSCDTVAPAAGPGVTVNTGSAGQSLSGGDADAYLDNCEDGTLNFTVTNTGLGDLTNVHIVGVTPSNPGVDVTTSFPSPVSSSNPPILAQGETGNGSFSYTAGGLAAGETLTFEVEIDADEMATSKLASLTVTPTETDMGPLGTYTFEAGDDGWQGVLGTFNRSSSSGGAGGSSWYMASSSNLDNQCDQIRSPEIWLNNDSTLTLSTRFEIEARSSGFWWDRANVGIIDQGNRTLVNPDGGRTYNADGPYGPCGTAGQAGWADTMDSWASSSWSSGALNASAYTGRPVQLDVIYGTDQLYSGYGFRFDEVTVTNAQVQVADAQSDTCGGEPPPDPECGNGILESGESCEPKPLDLGGASCTSLGYLGGGVLSCDDNCNFVTVDCVDPLCGDGICSGNIDGVVEDCNSCTADCGAPAPIPASDCGNGLCEAGDGENCATCPEDCAGILTGKPSGRFCCGFGDSQLPDGCGDDRCTTGGFSCDEQPTGNGGVSCCGDEVCEGQETSGTCEVDCGPAPFCGDSVCNGNEDQCSCVTDCGTPPSSEAGFCTDGIDNNCVDGTDCDDPSCSSDPACAPPACDLGQPGDPCPGGDGDCCSGKCRGKPGEKTCR